MNTPSVSIAQFCRHRRELGRPRSLVADHPLLWLLLVVSVIATFAYVGRRRWRQLNAQAGQRAGEARLAERFAAGEIEEREYEQRPATLKRLGRTG